MSHKKYTLNKNWFGLLGILLFFVSGSLMGVSHKIELQDVKIRTISGNKAQIMLEFNAPPVNMRDFSLEEPSKIIVDFPDAHTKLLDDKTKQKLSLGVLKG